MKVQGHEFDERATLGDMITVLYTENLKRFDGNEDRASVATAHAINDHLGRTMHRRECSLPPNDN